MKRTVLIFMFAMMAMVYSQAQQIAVVTKNGATSVHQTLADAINEADPGSTIYLPGGGFQISDDVKIMKRLSIIGIGHKANSENADGNTVISGNLFFNEGSSNSAIIGCYISGNVNIGDGGASVNNVLIKYCNLNAVVVNNNTCSGTEINQNYIRNSSYFTGASAIMTNNILHSVGSISGGIIRNNIITSYRWERYGADTALRDVYNSTIANNIIINSSIHSGSDCTVYGNMTLSNWGDYYITVSDWSEVFVDYNNATISPASDFHFKGDYQQYSDCGIYGGTEPFSESSLPPVPYIVSKFIPEQTDASGKLNIKIRVKAGE